MKKENRKLVKRQFRSSRLEIHCQLYQEKCLSYNTALDKAKTESYSNKIENLIVMHGLFRIIDGFFKVKSICPLPSHVFPSELAETFSRHLNDKITNVRESLSCSTRSIMVLAIPPEEVSCKRS